MKKLPPDDKAGLYLTAIVHLSAVIILLIAGIGYSLKGEGSYLLDFSAYEETQKMQEEIERLQEEAAFKEEISRKLQAEIGESRTSAVMGVAVNRAALKDDRGTNAEELYKDAERLQKELSAGMPLSSEDYAIPTPQNKESDSALEEVRKAAYSGPSVVSYELEGRKASKMSIPAYRCLGGGEVTVIITVNPAGKVILAKVDEAVSSSDECLRSYAIRAARLSLFSAKSDAAPKQVGNIVYKFIAQ